MSLSGNNSVEDYFYGFQKTKWKRSESSNAAFPSYAGHSKHFWLNSPDRTHHIRSKDGTRYVGLVRENWATAAIGTDQKSRKDEKQKQMEHFLPAHTKNDFSLVAAEISQILHQILWFLSLSLSLFWPHCAHVKGYWFQIINLHWYSAWGVCVCVLVLVCPQVYPPLW